MRLEPLRYASFEYVWRTSEKANCQSSAEASRASPPRGNSTRLAEEGGDVEAVPSSRHRLGWAASSRRSAKMASLVECGPDGWVTEKPWARELAEELGLDGEVIPSNDATRKTYVLVEGKLVAMPDGMRMMVPTRPRLRSNASSLFSEDAKAAYRQRNNASR